MAAKFTVYKDKAGQFRFNLKAANGEIIATGESYPDKKSVLKGIASIQKNAAEAKIEDISDAEKPVEKPKKKPAKAKVSEKAEDASKEAPKPRSRKPKSE